MSGPHFMPFYIGDYLRDTQHLTTEEHGIYLLLLMACWTMGSLPDNRRRLGKITKIAPQKGRLLKNILDSFFVHQQDGCWHQKRIDKERQKIEKIKNERSKAGSKGSEKRWQSDNKPIARARVPEPESDKEPSLKGRRLRPGASARQRAGGALAPAPAGEAKTPTSTDECVKMVARALSRPPEARKRASSQANPPDGFPAADRDREKLRQRAYDFAAQKYPEKQRRAAFLGLGGGDPEHDAEWWLDTLNECMEVEQWQQT